MSDILNDARNDANDLLKTWDVQATAVPDAGLPIERAASEAECLLIAKTLGLPSMKSLAVACRVKPLGGGTYSLKGTVRAQYAQACIVTLEPVETAMDELIDAVFVPGPDQKSASKSERHEGSKQASSKKSAKADSDNRPAILPENEISILDGPDTEPIENGRIAVGRVIIETFVAGLDPYPRKQGAEFDWTDSTAGADNPFAVLGKLKDRDKSS